MKPKYLLNLIAALLAIVLTGCGSIGVKEKHTVVYVTLGQHHEALNDLIRIATDDKIPVTVGGVATELNIAGYYVIHGQDLKDIRDDLNGGSDER